MKITKLYPPKHNNFVLDDLPFHSLTLFGAMANCYVSLFGSESFPEFISLFEIGKISSIFPALKINDKEILFLPKPYLAKQKDKKYDEYISKKKIKKIRWLSLASIKQLGISIQQNGNDYFHSVDFLKDFTLIGNEFLITKNELTPEIVEKISLLSFYKKTDTVRVNVARFGQESIPFPQAEIRFIDASNEEMKIKLFLYFLEDMDNKKWNATKDLFADEGIGGKRNLGKGWFKKIETSNFSYNIPENPKLYLLLSNLIPQKEELKNILSYDTGIDDGFITFGYASTLKKDALFYIKEGSIINSKITGKICKQKFDDKIIYRYGKAFLLPLGGAENE